MAKSLKGIAQRKLLIRSFIRIIRNDLNIFLDFIVHGLFLNFHPAGSFDVYISRENYRKAKVELIIGVIMRLTAQGHGFLF